jgi:uncharacterized protein (TIGR00730 family)
VEYRRQRFAGLESMSDQLPDGAERIVCVYCASSSACHPDYRAAAYRLGEILGALADGALSQRGRVVGVIPEFMVELEWEHPGITELRRVEDMRTRKHLMLSQSHAVVALPGGTGTLEELLEAITLKRLGLYLNPIVLVNTCGFYDSLINLLNHAVAERFMGEQHRSMWQVVQQPEEVLPAIATSPNWPADAIKFAAQY